MKYLFNSILLIVLALNLTSCAAALVPETNDPEVKINQGYQLIPMGRSLAAEKVMKQALNMYMDKKDDLGAAKANVALAHLYAKGQTHGDLKLPDFRKAAEAQKAAADLFSHVGYKMHQSMMLWMSGVSYSVAGDRETACKMLQASTSSFDPKATDTEGLVNPDQLPVRIKTDQQSLKCK